MPPAALRPRDLAGEDTIGLMTPSPEQAASGEHVDLHAPCLPITGHPGDLSSQVQGVEVSHADMRRTVSAWLALDVVGDADLLICLGVASGTYLVDERLVITHDGQSIAAEESPMRHGARVHRCRAATGRVEVRYDATVTGRDAPQSVTPADLVEYLRPSRHAEADEQIGVAHDVERQPCRDGPAHVRRCCLRQVDWRRKVTRARSHGNGSSLQVVVLARGGLCVGREGHLARSYPHPTTLAGRWPLEREDGPPRRTRARLRENHGAR